MSAVKSSALSRPWQERASEWKARAKNNLSHYKVQVLSSGVSAGTFGIGAATLSLLGGPIGVIAALGFAALMTLGVFLKSLLAQPRQITIDATGTTSLKDRLFEKVKGVFSAVVNAVKAHPVRTAVGVATAVSLGAGFAYRETLVAAATPIVTAVGEKLGDTGEAARKAASAVGEKLGDAAVKLREKLLPR